MRRLGWLAGLAALHAACIWVVEPDLPRLLAGIPRMLGWFANAFPPDFSGLPDLLRRAAETVAIATLGTSVAALLALPLTFFATRPVAPLRLLHQPARALLDLLRGVDSFVFALVLVAAVGLGPFAGMLGVALHSAGSLAKLWSETLEAADPALLEAATSAGGSRAQAAAVVLLPETLPQTASSLLYVWEFNIRASTVLGLVGAGGLGQELKNAVDLLDFTRVVAILSLIVALVFTADRLSAALRRRLL
ncbi:phosphonate ABC transporter, permease protein PhnE [Falsiroseomonas sp. HC035]|uniref:phosphonate ABC transporter, permease protein PhnE n=1 Tax=Falsiroseomonas sp. HC035 TaxID=3390999 RepID=UPI003D321BCD